MLKYKSMENSKLTTSDKVRSNASLSTLFINNHSDINTDMFCVYTHTIIGSNVPFYVGQGSIERAFFIKHSRTSQYVNHVNGRYDDVVVEIIKYNLTKDESLELENDLIKQYGKVYDNTGVLINILDENIKSVSLKGSLNGNYGKKYDNSNLSKPVIQIDIYGKVVKRWASATEVEETDSRYDSACINGCCNNKRQHHLFYQWIFETDFDENKDYMFNPTGTVPAIYLCFHDNGSLESIHMGKENLKEYGYNANCVNAVANGTKKTHKSKTFINFYKLDKETRLKFEDVITSETLNAIKI